MINFITVQFHLNSELKSTLLLGYSGSHLRRGVFKPCFDFIDEFVNKVEPWFKEASAEERDIQE